MRDRVDDVLDQWGRERPDLDVTPMGVVGRIARLRLLFSRSIDETMHRHGLSQGEFDILATLRRCGAPYRLTPGRLQDSMMVSGGAVTGRIDRLVGKGLVSREVDPLNRRSLLVTLTGAGLDLVDRVVEDHVAGEHDLLAALSPAQREDLAGLLRTLLAAHGDTPES